MRRSFFRYTAIMLALALLLSVGSVFASWKYYTTPIQPASEIVPLKFNEFKYDVHPMPDKEVVLLQRLGDLLNNDYTNDVIESSGKTSSEYLLSTLNKNWDYGETATFGSFVGSMDSNPDSKEHLNVLFGDIIDFNDPNHVSFILKAEDLIGDDKLEIALYSTTDPLDYDGSWQNVVVGVYLSVFTPIYDGSLIVGYELVCDSIHGYCTETVYTTQDPSPSFSTNHWRDELFYYHELEPYVRPIVGEDRYKYEYYHGNGFYPFEGRIDPYSGWIIIPSDVSNCGITEGKTASQKLAEILQG